MNENTLQFMAVLKLVWLCGFVALYSFGGISRKYLRRFVGSSWMMLGIFTFSHWQNNWSYWYLTYLPLFIIALSMGYGADEYATKLRKRFIYGLGLSLAALPLAWVNSMWPLYMFHVALCVSTSVFFGVFQPAREARSEESIIATLSTVLVLFMI